jgi:hypothetical protein
LAKILRWVGPTTYTDGSPFGEADFAGYEIQVNDSGAVALPVQFNPDNTYEFDLESLASVQAEAGAIRSYKVELRTVAKNGQVSDWSESLTFSLDLRIPNPPTELQVS